MSINENINIKPVNTQYNYELLAKDVEPGVPEVWALFPAYPYIDSNSYL